MLHQVIIEMEEKYVQKLPSNQGQYDQIYTVMYISM